jgi:nitrite reductase/ring-hydroxylating ferredoxin subunit
VNHDQGMTSMVRLIPRAALAENTVLVFEVAGTRCLVADVDGDVQAYAVAGPSARRANEAAVAEGRLRCPLHGWPIDPVAGRCGAAERCEYRPLPVEIAGDDIRVTLPDRDEPACDRRERA